MKKIRSKGFSGFALRLLSVAIFLFMLSLAMPPEAEAAGIEVEVAAVAVDVIDRSPVGVDDKFGPGIDKLYCYTKITGASAGDKIEHRWYWGEKLMATVELNIGASSWRTYSSKRIIRPWKGDWRVDVVSGDEVLKSVEFVIESVKTPDLGD